MSFESLNLIEPLQRAVREQGYTTPTPIQLQAVPPLLAGNDLLGCAQTGTGKTAAFSLPILQKLQQNRQPGPRRLRVLVLAPTRELALQIAESFETYGHYTPVAVAVIFGGVGQQPQVDRLRRGVDVLVATPGRLIDLMGQGHVRLGDIDTLVLDEADRMLDMGFVRDVKRIVERLPVRRQTMLFSATLAPEVVDLARGMLRDPVHVSVTPQATTVEKIKQSVYFVETGDKRPLLERLLRDPAIERAIVFTRTKHGADKVVKNLAAAEIEALALHGNKSQNQRVRALDAFKDGSVRVLVATDIAARGIDVEGISHVFNYDLPNIPDSYVHRIGRTARAGAEGMAVSFCAVDERPYLRDIERLIRQSVPVADAGPLRSSVPMGRSAAPASQGQGQRPGGQSAHPRSHTSPRPQHDNQRPAQPSQGHGQRRHGAASGSGRDGQSQGQRQGQGQGQRSGQQRPSHAQGQPAPRSTHDVMQRGFRGAEAERDEGLPVRADLWFS